MNTDRRSAIIVGILYIIGTAAGILSVVVTGAILDAPDSLALVSANANRVILGGLFILTMGLALAMVPVVMYPILKRHNQVLALGYVVFRGALEGVTYLILAISWFSVVTLSQLYVQAGAPVDSGFQIAGTSILGVGATSFTLTEIIFPLGALMFYYVLYESKLIPRWLSGWGLVAGVLYFAEGLMHVFAFVSPGSMILTAMLFPMLIQEMVMAVWLIVKGFNSAAIASGSARVEAPPYQLAHNKA